jgi:Ca2+-binding RTX toxin-like protein
MLNNSKRKFFSFPLMLIVSACGGRVADALKCAGSENCGSKIDDTITGGPKSDTIIGFSGNDILNGMAGEDVLKGYDGDDIIDGGAGDDLIEGGEDNDTIKGGLGNDKIYGGSGDDKIDGQLGSDHLFGDNGDDIISFSLNDTIADGGQGIDTLTISDVSGSSQISISFKSEKMFKGVNLAPVNSNILGFEILIAEIANDLSVTDKENTVSIKTGAGDDNIVSIASEVSINTGDGNDNVTKHNGAGSIDTGNGDDVVDLLNLDQTSVVLGDGNDSVKIRGNFDTIDGGLGNDTLIVSEHWLFENTVFSLESSTVVTNYPGLIPSNFRMSISGIENISYSGALSLEFVGDSLANNISGGISNDILSGGGGDDILSGGDGNDVINGDSGSDILNGGNGNDKFVFSKIYDVSDTINDFVISDDILQFIDDTDLSLVGTSNLKFVSGQVGALTNGSNIIDETHNVIVITEAVDDVGAAITSIKGGNDANVGDGVIVIAAASTEGSFAKVWYDTTADASDTVEIAELSGITVLDLASLGEENFLII